jgi:hypothetical protein
MASTGQMSNLLARVYAKDIIPSSVNNDRNFVDDVVIHDYVKDDLLVRLVRSLRFQVLSNKSQDERVMDEKYRRPIRRGGFDYQTAYHLNGVRDLASLRNGAVASALNAESYNAFASRKSSPITLMSQY